MTSTQELLEALAPDIEAYLKPRLRGFIGAFVRAYLPQHWTFETEEGASTVTIAPTGEVTVAAGTVPAPDVTVKGPRARLDEILKSRQKPAGKVTDVAVVAHTAKGRAALQQVRSRFGL